MGMLANILQGEQHQTLLLPEHGFIRRELLVIEPLQFSNVRCRNRVQHYWHIGRHMPRPANGKQIGTSQHWRTQVIFQLIDSHLAGLKFLLFFENSFHE